MRKQIAPTSVPRLETSAFQTSPEAGTTYPATAETPKATDPSMFATAIHQPPRLGLPIDDLAVGVHPGEPAGHEERDRAQRVGPPHPLVLGGRVEVDAHCVPRAPVEPQGAGELHRTGEPVRRSAAPTPRTGGRCGSSHGREVVDRLAVLQERRGREEQRPDEERERGGPQPDRFRVVRHRAEREEARADDEQDRDPPASAARPERLVAAGSVTNDHPNRAMFGDERAAYSRTGNADPP